MGFRVELHPGAKEDLDSLDPSVRRDVTKRIDVLSENPFIGKPLGNVMGINLTGYYKLYAARKRYRIVYHLVGNCLEIVEIVGIGKRERSEIYKIVAKRLFNKN